jgi:hypothetical protein
MYLGIIHFSFTISMQAPRTLFIKRKNCTNNENIDPQVFIGNGLHAAKMYKLFINQPMHDEDHRFLTQWGINIFFRFSTYRDNEMLYPLAYRTHSHNLGKILIHKILQLYNVYTSLNNFRNINVLICEKFWTGHFRLKNEKKYLYLIVSEIYDLHQQHFIISVVTSCICMKLYKNGC